MALVSRSFQDPSYVTRQSLALGNIAAGAAGVSTKFTTHAAVLLFSLNLMQQILGTSTYTQGGTGTGSGQQVSVIVISNTSTTTASIALGTTTIGPFLAGGTGTVAQVNAYVQYAINTNTAVAGQPPQNYGGVAVPAGSLVYCVTGTDATASTNVSIDYQINTGAGLTA